MREVWLSDHRTKGGDNDTEAKELAVTPTSPSLPDAVMMATPVGKLPSARRNALMSNDDSSIAVFLVSSAAFDVFDMTIPFRRNRCSRPFGPYCHPNLTLWSVRRLPFDWQRTESAPEKYQRRSFTGGPRSNGPTDQQMSVFQIDVLHDFTIKNPQRVEQNR